MINLIKRYYYLYKLKNAVFRFDSPLLVPINTVNWILTDIDGGEASFIVNSKDSQSYVSLELESLEFDVLQDIYNKVKASK